MGSFYESLTLFGAGDRQISVEARVDTSAMFSVVPASILRELGVAPIDSIPVRFASGQTNRLLLGEVIAELQDVRRPILCLFGSENAPALIGAHTLEAFLMTVDMVEQKLVPKEALLM